MVCFLDKVVKICLISVKQGINSSSFKINFRIIIESMCDAEGVSSYTM